MIDLMRYDGEKIDVSAFCAIIAVVPGSASKAIYIVVIDIAIEKRNDIYLARKAEGSENIKARESIRE